MAIQIGNYTRPGIFINEIDNSVITSPTQTGVTPLVIGFSKTGPINTPILLTNVNDIQNNFGSIDRSLERNGSFFHRTLNQMILSSPVFAINLLATDDTLDQIQYMNISTSTSHPNDVIRNGAYRKFFDTTGFWKLDPQEFNTLAENDPLFNTTLLRFTNVSAQFITVFVFKTKVSGFDSPIGNFYSAVNQVPPYVYSTDYASDYMVDVLVVSGDWSNYQQLSVDPRFSRYFNNTGLIKSQVTNFSNDRNVITLKYYQGLSLIPFFRDLNGKNIYIETIINADTNTTGLFCAFNEDLFETSAPNGLADIVGNNLVNSQLSDISFLSYKETIVEQLPYSNVVLDIPGNVVGIDGGSPTYSFRSSPYGGLNRTGYYSEGYINGVFNATFSSSTSSISITYGIDSVVGPTDSSYAIIGGNKVFVAGTASFTINSSAYQNPGVYTSTFALDTTGNITKIDNINNSNAPSVPATSIVLGYVTFSVSGGVSGTFSSATLNPVAISGTAGYSELVFGTPSGDYFITSLGGGVIKVDFLNTAVNPSFANYAQYRRIKQFNAIINILDSANFNQATMLLNATTQQKVSLAGMTVSNVIVSTTANKSFTLSTGLSVSDLTQVINNGLLLFYIVDNEFIVGTNTLSTKSETATTTNGVVAKYSQYYQNYYNGIIDTGDFFYENILADTLNVQFKGVSGSNYIVFSKQGATSSGFPYIVTAGQQIIVPESTLNSGSFSITSNVNYAQSIGITSSGNYAYILDKSITSESLTNVNTVFDPTLQHYLQNYISASGSLVVNFTDSTLQASYPITNLALNKNLVIWSDIDNFRETVEIVIPAGYTQSDNKILVNSARYTSLVAGDFLEAYVAPVNDPTNILYNPENGVPKRLTRILSKRSYAPDTTLVELTCDAAIKKTLMGGTASGDYQTTRYTQFEDYVSTYKAITLKGFRVRQASMPDGTEARQNSILNIIANGTPLFKAIANKDAFDFRYLIDSFGLGLIENSKQQLMDICGARLDCLGFLNMPSMKSFKNSTSPSFVDSDGNLSIQFVAEGGNPESSPAFLYSFGIGQGTTTVGYFCPYLTVNDNGRPLNVPPAMFVATTYMAKQNSNITNIVPWTIAAGITNGKISGITGVEMDFTPSDISFLNQAQMNPIVLKRNRGYVIETENTALTLYKSSLSFLHVREVLIELERDLSAMLLDFQWKFNTADVRAEIKLRADVICASFVNKNGLFNYFNKCDDENNTPDIIDNQIGVLDTYVEPVKGMGIIVNNITILRTGAIASGGFITV